MTVAAQHPNLFRFLSAIDEDLAAKSRVQGCGFCGGVLHSARYPRKPRGGPMQAQASSLTTRQSFCCERCRRRTTPASVRFLGRRFGRGAQNAATLAPLVARDFREDSVLANRARTIHAADRACRFASRTAGTISTRRSPVPARPVHAVPGPSIGAWRGQTA